MIHKHLNPVFRQVDSLWVVWFPPELRNWQVPDSMQEPGLHKSGPTVALVSKEYQIDELLCPPVVV